MDNFSYIDELNTEQRLAVETVNGPVLVLAGAGTGKTRALTTRLAHILKTGHAHPGEILAVTFTNKAAFEMKNRVAQMLGAQVDGWWLGTFHSLCARMLRIHSELVGLKSNYTILDADDQLRLLKQIMLDRNIDIKRWPPKLVMTFIQTWKDKAKTPDMVTDNPSEVANGQVLGIYAEYQDRMTILNACDFGDLLLHVITIFRDPKNADILEKYQERFKYILVDEYQDTNVAQYLWLRLLAQKHKNICCVGDDDQSIYGWRGAEIGNILKFEKDFEGAKVIRLEQNYRSTKNILAAANGVIAYNKNRLGKDLWSADAEGDKLLLQGVWDGLAEASAVVEKIEELHRKGVPFDQIAVLVRAAHQTRPFEEKFMRESIPHKVLAGMRFYERQEIRDAIAYLRVVAQPDDDLAFERIINVPKRGIGVATVNKIRGLAREKEISFNSALELILQGNVLRGKTKATLKTLTDNFERWRSLLRDISHVELAQLVLEDSGYIDKWKNDKTPEAAGRLENLKEFINALNEFEDLGMFLEHISLVMDTDTKDPDEKQVTIMTYHAAKGLEYDVVMMPGWEEGLFPNQRAIEESGEAGLEEERRLAYVGITRARKRAFIYYAASRLTYGSWETKLPSRFIDELPKEYIEVAAATATGVYKNTGAGNGGGYHGRRASLVEEPSHSLTMESAAGFTEGDRVFHQKFGYGNVTYVEGDKLDIRFEKSGRKKLLESFVEKVD